MRFKYKINLEIDVDFDAPLLGTDTTKGKRSKTDMIAKTALAEMIKLKTTSYVGLDRVIDEDNLTGTIKGSIMLRSHKMLDEDNKKLRYTACQRRIESYRKKCNMISRWEKLNNNIIEEETKLSNQNCKTIDYNKFKIYIKEKTILNDKVKNFYEQDIHRKFKWRTWIYQRKSEDNFISNIEKTYGKKEDILLCYGNWSNTKQMKYLMPTKGIGMRRAIEKKFDVVLVDEFKTSKLCSCCHGELENYKINKKKLHRLLICRSCKSNGLENKNITFMNRDMNACINIRKISSDWINHKSRNNNFCRNTCIDSSKGEKQCRSIVFT